MIQARILSGKYLTDKLSRHWTKNSLGLCTVGRAEKWKNYIFKCADVDYYGTMYIKQASIENNRIF